MAYLRIVHGDIQNDGEMRVLETVRRTLSGLMGHGSIGYFTTTGNNDWTRYNFGGGSEHTAGVLTGLMDVVTAMMPADWKVEGAAE